MPEWLARLDIWLVAITLGFLAWLESRALRQKISGWITWYRSRPVSRLRSEAMSSEPNRPDTNRFDQAPNRPDTSDLHQVKTDIFDLNELILELTKRSLTREQFLTLLARSKNPNGDYWMSANKISAAIGGTNAENLAAIRSHRPEQNQPAAPPAARLERPRNGW